ncbi:MAG TPA: class I SAM-dependent methyltransferase [Burkholderiaceae bacterium]|nr:class I SAM-dependent methyltransferase [Burkholderiaceae bacterium]
MSARFASFYARFEDKFRGARAVICARLLEYVPLLQVIERDGASAVDLGCGRGEWLELLRDRGWRAHGVDLDDQMLARCTALGLDVRREDAVAHLRALPAASLDLVSGFHVVEHLPLDVLLDVVAEARRVLRPGGLAIFETPNPENLQVGAHTFYLDPTHVRPLPPGLLSFIVQEAGFGLVDVLRLHPYEELALGESADTPPAVAESIRRLFGPQDYAVIGLNVASAADPLAEPVSTAIERIRRDGAATTATHAQRLAAAEQRAAAAEAAGREAGDRAGRAEAEAQRLREAFAAAEGSRARLDAELAALRGDAQGVRQERDALQVQLDAHRVLARDALERCDRAAAELDEMKNSLLWRAGGPAYRGLRSLLRGK